MSIDKLVGKLPELTEGEMYARSMENERQRLLKPARRAQLRSAGHNPWPVTLDKNDKIRLMTNVDSLVAWPTSRIYAKFEDEMELSRKSYTSKRQS